MKVSIMSESRTILPEWESHRFSGLFSVDLPQGICPIYEDDGSLLIFPLPTSPASELFVGSFPTPESQPMTLMLLREQVERFMTDCVKADNASFETPADVDESGVIAWQAVAEISDNVFWIARVYARRYGDHFLLMHWHGDADTLRTLVLPIFVSVRLELS